MKSFVTSAITAALLLATPMSTFAQEKMACEGKKLTRSQVKTLIKTAKTPEEHHKLACYFQSEARAESEKAKYHEEMGKLYAGSSNAKHDMVTHCKQFAEEARKAADIDKQLASEHEQMAEEARKAQ